MAPRTAKRSADTLTAPDRAMFDKLKIPRALLDAAGIRHVTDAEARALGIVGKGDMAGTGYPCIDPSTGEMVTLRVRRDHPEIKDGKPERKYIAPPGPKPTLYIHPHSVKKLKSADTPIVLVEAEKSALALLALCERTGNELIPVACGGCWGWSQDKKALPALLAMCKGHPVYVLLDANAATNPHVKEAQSALAAELSTPAYACPEVLIAALPQLEGVNGPDDLVAQNDGDARLLDVLEAATPADSLGEYSDDALAQRFTAEHGDDLRYVDKWGQWLAWGGACWQRDETLSVYDKARAICRAAADECGKKQIAQRLRSAQTVAAVERLARSDRSHAATGDQWDSDLWILNTPAGVVDLRTGKLRPARREDHCTKITAAAPGGECKLWLKFLSDVTGGDKELQRFLQRMAGYCLTGVTYEHALFFLYGTGANGKSTFINVLVGILGDYARTAAIETFTASTNEHHPTDLAGMQGARLVTATETEEGRRWAESKLKSLTGGDKISARFMRQDFFEFTPQFKLVVSGNHRPGLRSVDRAIRRRMNLVPFDVTIPGTKCDVQLPEKLQAEWGGILQWIVDGCLAWQRGGLSAPKAVTAATDDYMAAEDALGRWLAECAVTAKSSRASSYELFQAWKRWTDNENEFAGTQKRFSQNLEARGFVPQKSHGDRYFIGLRLRRAGERGADGAAPTVIGVKEYSKTNSLTGITGSHAPSAPLKKFSRAGRTVQGRIQ